MKHSIYDVTFSSMGRFIQGAFSNPNQAVNEVRDNGRISHIYDIRPDGFDSGFKFTLRSGE